MAPEDRTPPPEQDDAQAASGGHVGVGFVRYAEAAPRLLDNGYAPLPILPGTKHPPLKGWTSPPIDAAQVDRWARQYAKYGVGLRTGQLVGIDIDILDPDLAHAAGERVQQRFGATLMRVGLWPKRLLLYRTKTPFRKLQRGGIEILGLGQQFVAFGIHKDTLQPYSWPLGDSPLDVALDNLPEVDEAGCRTLLAELAPAPQRRARAARGGGRPEDAKRPSAQGPIRDKCGRVIDGRDSWLSVIAYHAVQDAMEAGVPLDAAQLAEGVWRRFTETTDLDRPKQDGADRYDLADASRKVADKLRLLSEGRLPLRAQEALEPVLLPDALPVAAARARLDATLAEACARIEDWHAGEDIGPAPQMGIKATVGLGKSSAARAQLIPLRRRLAAAGAPDRLLILTPSLALADETAAAWRAAGERVAVLRGYERADPVSGRPMCENLPAVRAATEAGEDIRSTACISATGDRRCPHLAGCLKQANRDEVSDADVIVAAYDALFTGFAIQSESIGLIVIDEGFWQRSFEPLTGLGVETFADEGLGASAASGRQSVGDMADLRALRLRAVSAFRANGVGPLRRSHLVAAGLTAEGARLAAQLERQAIRRSGLHPGMSAKAMPAALAQAGSNARSRLRAAAWDAIEALLAGSAATDGRVGIGPPDGKTGLHPITVLRLKPIHLTLLGKPVLHLDATLRPEIARTLLPRLEMTEIAAEAPNMHLRLVAGPFGKGSLCDNPRANAAERKRRANRLRECVDYVYWHARRFTRTLVVTYKDIETAFAGIPGVAVAHFNAIAGLDVYRDVDLLIVIGRPLPGTDDVASLSAAVFGHVPEGSYQGVRKGVPMRSGQVRGVSVPAHRDAWAEILRAAICDDEVIQAIGRGRGVNRSEADPLEVHVLADVALPLVHDRVSDWDAEAPDILQRMLLAGIAVDSPADAARLHPSSLQNAEQAKKTFLRAAFKGQTLIRDLYREMSLKSAAYRRPGRGRSWQRAFWIDGSADDAKARLESAIGVLAGWRPD